LDSALLTVMDSDQRPVSPPQHHENAQAGPSTLPLPPPIFLPPSGPPPAPIYLTSTQDLLARFNLLPSYDKYVRPYVTPVGHDHPPTPTPIPDIKGKGKEKEVTSPAAAQTPGDDQDQDQDDDGDGPGGKGEKKKKNNYKHLIKGVAGKHSMKKDDYLTRIMQEPPKERMAITPFDLKSLDAFTVSLEGLKSWNINTLVVESAQAREDRKKRKEAKRLAKAQAIAQPPPIGLGTPQPIPTPGPTPARTGTPKPTPAVQIPTGVPVKVSQTGTPTTPNVERRGKKREREDGGAGVLGGANGGGAPPKSALNAKAGLPGIRPKKKQRVDVPNQPRDIPIPVQQPTPQGA